MPFGSLFLFALSYITNKHKTWVPRLWHSRCVLLRVILSCWGCITCLPHRSKGLRCFHCQWGLFNVIIVVHHWQEALSHPVPSNTFDSLPASMLMMAGFDQTGGDLGFLQEFSVWCCFLSCRESLSWRPQNLWVVPFIKYIGYENVKGYTLCDMDVVSKFILMMICLIQFSKHKCSKYLSTIKKLGLITFIIVSKIFLLLIRISALFFSFILYLSFQSSSS